MLERLVDNKELSFLNALAVGSDLILINTIYSLRVTCGLLLLFKECRSIILSYHEA